MVKYHLVQGVTTKADYSTSKLYIRVMLTSRELFWKYGFKRVTIEEICEKSDVSKMSFYRFFPNKTELARAVFDKVVDEGLATIKDVLNNNELSSAHKVQKLLLMKLEGTHEISQEFLQDFYSNPELGLKEHIEEKTKNAWKEIVDDFRNAQLKGLFRADFKPELLFYVSQKMQDVIADKSLLALYDNPQALVMDIANLMIYGIVKHADNP